MAMLADTVDAVVGIDTHTDSHTACVLDAVGRQLAVITVPADPRGYREVLAWAARNAPGPKLAWSVEGARSHGVGLTRYLLWLAPPWVCALAHLGPPCLPPTWCDHVPLRSGCEEAMRWPGRSSLRGGS